MPTVRLNPENALPNLKNIFGQPLDGFFQIFHHRCLSIFEFIPFMIGIKNQQELTVFQCQLNFGTCSWAAGKSDDHIGRQNNDVVAAGDFLSLSARQGEMGIDRNIDP